MPDNQSFLEIFGYNVDGSKPGVHNFSLADLDNAIAHIQENTQQDTDPIDISDIAWLLHFFKTYQLASDTYDGISIFKSDWIDDELQIIG